MDGTLGGNRQTEMEFLRTFGASSGIIGWELDLLTWRFTYIAPRALEVFGYPLEDWRKENFWADHLHPDDRETALNACAMATARGEDHVLEYRMIAQDDRVVWIRDLVSVEMGEDGMPKTLRGIMIDITQHRNTEETLVTTIEQLSRSNAELERFAYIASHDLQEPLRTIVAFSQLAERRLAGHPDREVQEYLGLVAAAGKRMSSLITDLLAYARSGGQLNPTPDVSLTDVVGAALENVAESLAKAPCVIHVDSLPTIECDRERIIQVFQNLLSNAIKFRHPDRMLRIRVSCEEFGEVVSLAVEDNGIGIPPQYFNDVFEAFKRLHHHSTIPGSGIGLAVVQRNVEMHGGRAWVESPEGQGSSFHFTLPRCPVPPVS